MEHGMVTQRAVVLLLSLLQFVSLPNKCWEAQELQMFVVFIAALMFLNSQ